MTSLANFVFSLQYCGGGVATIYVFNVSDAVFKHILCIIGSINELHHDKADHAVVVFAV